MKNLVATEVKQTTTSSSSRGVVDRIGASRLQRWLGFAWLHQWLLVVALCGCYLVSHHLQSPRPELFLCNYVWCECVCVFTYFFSFRSKICFIVCFVCHFVSLILFFLILRPTRSDFHIGSGFDRSDHNLIRLAKMHLIGFINNLIGSELDIFQIGSGRILFAALHNRQIGFIIF